MFVMLDRCSLRSRTSRRWLPTTLRLEVGCLRMVMVERFRDAQEKGDVAADMIVELLKNLFLWRRFRCGFDDVDNPFKET